MNLAVCLKQVPDPATVEVDPITGVIDSRRLLPITNPADEVALELALQLRQNAAPLRVLTVGPEQADATLRAALAAGADQALRLWDASLLETHPTLTALLLAAALRTEGLPDMVLCGTRSADRGSGQVPALLGEHLGWPVVTDVTRLDLHANTARIQRRLDRGAREEVEVALPAVIAVEPGLVRLRHAALPRLIAAQRATIPARSPADLGLQASDMVLPLPLRRAALPPRPRSRAIFMPNSAAPPHERIGQIITAGVTRKSGKVLEGAPDQMADAIVAFLRERGFVG